MMGMNDTRIEEDVSSTPGYQGIQTPYGETINNLLDEQPFYPSCMSQKSGLPHSGKV